ncbi:BCD family MFS transporter [Aurantiacibacter spongiae]|uniref:MFS transporter n=1 Tax=Aurantiacibacter spongiae TaxID=2488860 RepID=A0A3N5CT10_9SPHN|nr:BCD family MFS transporter [Aurantiacibacter spongiae]RPF71777.1 MFS transporter [Aurantiacibacter spongiae]
MTGSRDDALLGWIGVMRVGAIQASLGAIVVLTTSLLNRIMVVELALAASVPGALVAFHYVLQVLRPRWGHASDRLERRTPFIAGGMTVLAGGGIVATLGTALLDGDYLTGMLVVTGGFGLIGIGVGMAGTALLTMLAEHVEDARRGPAAAIVWSTMIAGFVVTTIIVSVMIDPFTMGALVKAGCSVSLGALTLALLALIGLEPERRLRRERDRRPFALSFAAVWAQREARRFTYFIFASMLAYSMQDLILEPFAGRVFALSPSQTTALTSIQNGATLAGMALAAIAARQFGGSVKALRGLTQAGCAISGLSLAILALCGTEGLLALLRPALLLLGLGNGVFAASAIALMMALATRGEEAGTRMGVWGAAQALAFGAGGLAGTVLYDIAARLTASSTGGYVSVFALEALLFVAAPAWLARGEHFMAREATA